MKPLTEGTVRLRVICENPPASPFGLQDKDGTIIEGENLEGDRVAFSLELKAKQTEDIPYLTGSVAHGSPKERFLYLTKKDNFGRILSRIKVPLKSIQWNQIEQVLDSAGLHLSVAVDGRRTGTVPLLGEGWTVEQ
ncbi:MAG: hypothetical protein KF812_10095 [Fimbriimonadaceae bacterium]|nr:hypothetical protein [Fimbriimonadaceae bacterium]